MPEPVKLTRADIRRLFALLDEERHAVPDRARAALRVDHLHAVDARCRRERVEAVPPKVAVSPASPS